MTRIILILGVLLLVGFVLSFRAPLPSLAQDGTVPVSPDELWTLNPEWVKADPFPHVGGVY